MNPIWLDNLLHYALAVSIILLIAFFSIVLVMFAWMAWLFIRESRRSYLRRGKERLDD